LDFKKPLQTAWILAGEKNGDLPDLSPKKYFEDDRA
jgi:hypothetical protein